MDKDELIEQYKIKHKNHESYGVGGSFSEIAELFDDLEPASSILDFGCGKGSLVKQLRLMGFDAKGYDPAIRRFENFPDREFDAVICMDVLEHIRKEDVDDIFQMMLKVDPKYIFLTIAHTTAINHLPNGRNCHETVETPFWWWSKIGQNFPEWSAMGLEGFRPSTSRWLLKKSSEKQQ